MSILGTLSLVLCIFLAVVLGIYVGNLFRNRGREETGKMKNSRNRH